MLALDIELKYNPIHRLFNKQVVPGVDQDFKAINSAAAHSVCAGAYNTDLFSIDGVGGGGGGGDGSNDDGGGGIGDGDDDDGNDPTTSTSAGSRRRQRRIGGGASGGRGSLESFRNNPVVQRSLQPPPAPSVSRASRIRCSDQYSRAIRPNNPGWSLSSSLEIHRREREGCADIVCVIIDSRVIRIPDLTRSLRRAKRDPLDQCAFSNSAGGCTTTYLGDRSCYDRAASRGTIMIYFRPHDGRSLRYNANARHLNVLVVPLFPLWIIGAFCVKDNRESDGRKETNDANVPGLKDTAANQWWEALTICRVQGPLPSNRLDERPDALNVTPECGRCLSVV
ncbi:hypothetical protein EAG_08647 [Camponotus floridanus]|uniref:Uncharacterized protein n=1 Tax=Camponotus floridanus TaxID=104421 RepID=E2AKB4_CAMFO|nr:hypothetical protein EAG_08647 [Camponotus floridanus]